MEQQLSLEGPLAWIGALMIVISFCTTIWGIFSGPAKALAKKVDDLRSDVDDHDHRLQRLEQTLQAMPSKDNFHELQITMTKMSGEMSVMRAVMEGNSAIMTRLEAVVTRHDEHLSKG